MNTPRQSHALIIHNQLLAGKIRSIYSRNEISDIWDFLHQRGTLDFKALPNGLFPAAALNHDKVFTGYSHVWVRDNVFIAYAKYLNGELEPARKTAHALMQYFERYQHRFTDIIDGKADPSDPMNRPHIRFNGAKLEETGAKWAHAQNDALGYFLWFFCTLLRANALEFSSEAATILRLFPRYFQKIAYWQDEDSGHWEEVRKISASSIGVVVAGLKELYKLMSDASDTSALKHDAELVAELIARGEKALNAILPAECVQSDPEKSRRYDAALLFLAYPLRIVNPATASTIVSEIIRELQGDIGIRRYPLDSYWAPDYKEKLKPAERTADFSENLSTRNKLLPRPGLEAQWCIFDPIVSCYFGMRFQRTHAREDLDQQTEYFNRALGQITAESPALSPFRCPELYYLEHERYVPNDHVPLLWTEANLLLALNMMRANAQ
jgi:glycosyl hydrolase family 15